MGNERYKGIIIGVALICLLGLGIWLSGKQHAKDMAGIQLTEEVTCHKNLALGDDWGILVNGDIQFIDLEQERVRPLCIKPDCNHNQVDECMAKLPMGVNPETLWIYNDKIYIYGHKDYPGNIVVYREDISGANHQCVAEYGLKEDEIRSMEIIGGDKKEELYIIVRAVCVDDYVADESGNIKDVPIQVYVLSYNCETNKIKEIAYVPDIGYQAWVHGREIKENRLYVDVSWIESPISTEEEFEQAKVLKEVQYIDLASGEIYTDSVYRYGDYLGTTHGESYYADYTDDDQYSGSIKIDGVEGNRRMDIKEIAGRKATDTSVLVLQDCIVVNSKENDTGRIALYTLQGDQEKVINNCGHFIIGENKNYYMLAEDIDGLFYPVAVVQKDNIEKINSKEISLYQ